MKTNSFDVAVYKELFWEKMEDVPALRFQLIELIEADSMVQLAREWGFTHRNQLIRYLQGPLKRRVSRVAGVDAVRLLRSLTYGTTGTLESIAEDDGSRDITMEFNETLDMNAESSEE